MPATERYQIDIFAIIILIVSVLIIIFLIISIIYFMNLMNLKPPTKNESTFLFWTAIILAIIFFGIAIYSLVRIFTHKSVIYDDTINIPNSPKTQNIVITQPQKQYRTIKPHSTISIGAPQVNTIRSSSPSTVSTSSRVVNVPASSSRVVTVPDPSSQIVNVPVSTSRVVNVPTSSSQIVNVPSSSQIVAAPASSSRIVTVPVSESVITDTNSQPVTTSRIISVPINVEQPVMVTESPKIYQQPGPVKVPNVPKKNSSISDLPINPRQQSALNEELLSLGSFQSD